MRVAPEPRALVLASLTLLAPSGALAAEAVDASGVEQDLHAPAHAETPLRVGTEYRLFGGVAVGRGIRFNDPYRLPTELGDDARSLSLTATYLDVSAGGAMALTGPWLHGAVVDAAFATDGVPQEVLTPAYLVLYQIDPRFGLRGRAGVPVVIEPDLNAGFELAGGGVMRLTGAIGLTADVLFSLFYGAATLEASRTAIPIASLELGVVYDYEVLP